MARYSHAPDALSLPGEVPKPDLELPTLCVYDALDVCHW